MKPYKYVYLFRAGKSKYEGWYIVKCTNVNTARDDAGRIYHFEHGEIINYDDPIVTQARGEVPVLKYYRFAVTHFHIKSFDTEDELYNELIADIL